MTRISITPAGIEDLMEVERAMRPTDRRECELRWGSVRKALRVSYSNSEKVWTVRAGGALLAVCGVAVTDHPEYGSAWVLTSQAVERYPIAFLRGSHRVLAMMAWLFPRLEGWILDSYERSVRWAKHLGFRPMESRDGFTRYVWKTNVVELDSMRPHRVRPERCTTCGRRWVAVAPVTAGDGGTECPGCGLMTGVAEEA